MVRMALAVLASAAVMAATLSPLPADAAPKRKKARPAASAASTSLDGRTLGRPRTCGFDYFQYDDQGTPMGPYCH